VAVVVVVFIGQHLEALDLVVQVAVVELDLLALLKTKSQQVVMEQQI
jgi:hypothetical protein